LAALSWAAEIMTDEWFLDDGGDSPSRVQGSKGVLADELHIAAGFEESYAVHPCELTTPKSY
jgi:hypothetical protein